MNEDQRDASPARAASLEALRGMANPAKPGLDVLVEDSARARRVSPLDLGLARELSFGTTRQRLWLEHVLARFLEKPLPDSAREVKEILLLSLYQLLFLDRLPPHAVVDDAVRLARASHGGHRFTRLVNGVLRNACRVPREQLLPDDATPWAVRYSVPDWLAVEMAQSLPEEDCAAFFAASNEPAALCLRLRGLEAASLEAEARNQSGGAEYLFSRGRIVPDCLVVAGGGAVPERWPSFQSGHVTVEDEGAQVAALLAGWRQGGRILDLCASPGGKTSHLADICLPGTEIIATDVSEKKLQRLHNTLRRLNLLERIHTGLAEATMRELGQASCDLVLVDAPCSGFGTLRRHPEIRFRRTKDDMAR
ncbi:hypothetical protein HZA57_07500, partial [Candidatus Poribacteria bacterium]|nr:hypothetical protein [Candidatus Poribacteria bacterium]